MVDQAIDQTMLGRGMKIVIVIVIVMLGQAQTHRPIQTHCPLRRNALSLRVGVRAAQH